MMIQPLPRGSLFQYLIELLVKKLLLMSNLNLPWWNLRQFPLALSLVVREEINSLLAPTFFQLAVESRKVSPEPPYLKV